METETPQTEATDAKRTVRAKKDPTNVEEVPANTVASSTRTTKTRKKDVEESAAESAESAKPKRSKAKSKPVAEENTSAVEQETAAPVPPRRSVQSKKSTATATAAANEPAPEVSAASDTVAEAVAPEHTEIEEAQALPEQLPPAAGVSPEADIPHLFGETPEEQIALSALETTEALPEAAVIEQMVEEAFQAAVELDHDALWDEQDEEVEAADAWHAGADGEGHEVRTMPTEELDVPVSPEALPVPGVHQQSPLWWLATVKRGDRYHMITVQASRATQAITGIEESGGGQVLHIQADIPGLPAPRASEPDGVADLPEVKRKKNGDSPVQTMDEAVTLLRALQTHGLAKSRAAKAAAPEQEILKVVIEYLERTALASAVPASSPAPAFRQERPPRYQQPEVNPNTRPAARAFQNEGPGPARQGFDRDSRPDTRGDERLPRPGFETDTRGKERWAPPSFRNDRNDRNDRYERGPGQRDSFNRPDRSRSDYNRPPGERPERSDYNRPPGERPERSNYNRPPSERPERSERSFDRTFDRPFDRPFNRSYERPRSNSFSNDRGRPGRPPYRSSRPPEDRPELNNRLRPPASQSFLPPPRLRRAPEDDSEPRKDRKRTPPKED